MGGKVSNNGTPTTKTSKNKLVHYIKAPFRALGRACDMYVNGISSCAGRIQEGRIIAFVPSAPRRQQSSHRFYSSSSSSRNTSVSSANLDMQELIRAASQGRLASLNSSTTEDKDKNPSLVPRSQSVSVGVGNGITRIDEDEAVEYFNEDINVKPAAEGVVNLNDVMYPRSRSYPVPDKSRGGRRRRKICQLFYAASCPN